MGAGPSQRSRHQNSERGPYPTRNLIQISRDSAAASKNDVDPITRHLESTRPSTSSLARGTAINRPARARSRKYQRRGMGGTKTVSVRPAPSETRTGGSPFAAGRRLPSRRSKRGSTSATAWPGCLPGTSPLLSGSDAPRRHVLKCYCSSRESSEQDQVCVPSAVRLGLPPGFCGCLSFTHCESSEVRTLWKTSGLWRWTERW